MQNICIRDAVVDAKDAKYKHPYADADAKDAKYKHPYADADATILHLLENFGIYSQAIAFFIVFLNYNAIKINSCVFSFFE
jgi:hypothetical protein